MPHSHLAEVFGFPTNNFSPEAQRIRDRRLCPFNNVVEKCTKTSKKNPLGVCSVYSRVGTTITCPVRFTQGHLATTDAANFFGFSPGTWEPLPEVLLKDKDGNSAGKIDLVLAVRDSKGLVVDFGGLEVQAVYITGNVRDPFEHYMNNPKAHQHAVWEGENPPHEDNLSSFKRLAAQIRSKGSILNSWGKKQAVAVHRNFFATLPELSAVTPAEADLAWFVYDLVLDSSTNAYNLEQDKVVYTRFSEALQRFATSEAGSLEEFESDLKRKLDNKRRRTPVIAPG